MKRYYDKLWKNLLNKNNMNFLFKRIPLDFYRAFARELLNSKYIKEEAFLHPEWGYEGTIGWGNALLKVCNENPQWMWIHDIEVSFNWIDFDELNFRIVNHMNKLYKRGKLL